MTNILDPHELLELLSKRYTKIDIISVYDNDVSFGNQIGRDLIFPNKVIIYGVDEDRQRFFQIPMRCKRLESLPESGCCVLFFSKDILLHESKHFCAVFFQTGCPGNIIQPAE